MMKRIIATVHDVLGHIMLVMAIATAAFFILEKCNPHMRFLTNSFSLGMVAAFALMYVIRFILELILDGKKTKRD